jgi:hypothetical protein
MTLKRYTIRAWKIIQGVAGYDKILSTAPRLTATMGIRTRLRTSFARSPEPHAAMPQSVRLERGITDGLLRFSVGLEDIDDLIRELRCYGRANVLAQRLIQITDQVINVL